MLQMPVSLMFIQSNSIDFCWATCLPARVMGHETLLPVFAARAISIFQKSCKPASWTWMSFTKAVSFTSPSRVGVSHQVTQAVLQFSVLCLNSIINTAKGEHISFYSASKGKARSRKGTEMKDITLGGPHPPGDEQTIPRIDGKYFQHCGRAGQASLFPHMAVTGVLETSNPAGRSFQTFHGVNLPRMTPSYALGQRQAGSCRVPVAALQLHSCWN